MSQAYENGLIGTTHGVERMGTRYAHFLSDHTQPHTHKTVQSIAIDSMIGGLAWPGRNPTFELTANVMKFSYRFGFRLPLERWLCLDCVVWLFVFNNDPISFRCKEMEILPAVRNCSRLLLIERKNCHIAGARARFHIVGLYYCLFGVFGAFVTS